MAEPRELVERLEREPKLPEGDGERFAGYGVMACPFSSGHILCHRRFPASSIGAGYTSVWHRNPAGRWAFYQDVPPALACPRFFGAAIAEASQSDIETTWSGPRSFRIAVADTLDWEIVLATTPVTRAMSAMGALMPDSLWRNPAVLKLMAAVAGVALRVGKLGLAGRSPNGQRFVANPLRIWSITSSRAVVDDEDVGGIGPVPEQARLGDFWVPQRGLFVIGRAFFEPLDAARHSVATSQTPAG